MNQFSQDRSVQMEQESKRLTSLRQEKRHRPKSMPALATKPPQKEQEYRRLCEDYARIQANQAQRTEPQSNLV